MKTKALVVTQVEVKAILPAADNRKIDEAAKTFTDMAANVQAAGVKEPLRLRPVGEGYEIVDGERRWRAARAVGLPTVPAIIEEMNDAQAKALRAILSMHREPLSSGDEGRFVADIIAAHGGDVNAAAVEIGQTAHWVRTRAQLVNLIEPWLEEMRNVPGAFMHWVTAHWVMVARLPKEAQQRALNDLKRGGYVPRTADELEARLGALQRQLCEAPWKLDDADLVKRSGACATCQKTTRAASSLFYETTNPDAVEKDNRCLDSGCWDRKIKAHGEALVAKALAEHPEALRLASHGTRAGVQRDYEAWEVEGAKPKDKGAQLAVIIGGQDAGKVMHVRIPAHTMERRKGAATEDTPEKKLEKLRAAHGYTLHQETFRASCEILSTGKRLKMPDVSTIMRLAAAFGAFTDVTGPVLAKHWKKVQAMKAEQLEAELWRGVLGMAESAEDEIIAQTVIEAGGLSYTTVQAEVLKAFPEPKEIAALEAQIKAAKWVKKDDKALKPYAQCNQAACGNAATCPHGVPHHGNDACKRRKCFDVKPYVEGGVQCWCEAHGAAADAEIAAVGEKAKTIHDKKSKGKAKA